jgi:outer membrane protein assembly factor BamE (lipoprotein component of BamABCDE complex)
MNAKFSKIVMALGTVLVLGSSAAHALTVTPIGDAKFKPIHAGLTEDQVRSQLGSPVTVLKGARAGQTLWTYNYTDTFGYNTEFDVYFDASGTATATDSLHPKF